MKWSLPIIPVWLLVALTVNAQFASSVFETYTGGNLNTWLYLTSFAQDHELLTIGMEATPAMLVMASKYMLLVLLAISAIYSIGKNMHNGFVYGIESYLNKKDV